MISAMPDFELAVRGNYQKVINNRTQAVLDGLHFGTRESTDTGKNQTRADIRKAGMGNRLAGTVQSKTYPSRGRSFSPTGMIYSKAPHIVGAHADGGIINAVSGAMHIPIEDSPAEKLRARKGETLLEAAERRFGKLQFIARRGKPPLLAAKMNVTAAGRFTKVRALKPLKTRQGPRINARQLATVPLFKLVRNVRLKKRLNTRQILDKARRRHPARLAFHMSRRLAESERATAIR